jgi:polyhydroxybutyrate depolymerase
MMMTTPPAWSVAGGIFGGLDLHPQLRPYRLNNRLGWGYCVRVPSCPPLCNTVPQVLNVKEIAMGSPEATARRRPAILRGLLFLLVGTLISDLGVAADVEQKIHIDGIDRHYLVHVPPGPPKGDAVPLLLVLHGGGGSASLAAKQTRFNDDAEREGYVVAYPDGTDRLRPLMNLIAGRGFLTWNAGGCCGYAMEHNVNDVGFLRSVVAAIEQSHRIDTRRIYAAGISNGGMMAYRLACEASDIFAAVGIVSGVLVSTPCAPHAAVSVIDFHGTDDQYVPLKGGIGRKSLTGTAFPPVQDTILFWVGLDECHTSQLSQTPQGVVAFRYDDCRDRTAVTYYVIQEGGHAWPGGDRIMPLLDPPPTALSATAMMWQFFAAHPKK